MILRASSIVCDRLGRARHDRHAGLPHQLARACLRAHRLDRRCRRPDEHGAAVLERLGEGRVLGQEAVAGVDRLGARALDRLDQLLDVEVALGGRPGAEQVGLVGALDVERVAVELGVDGDGRDPELLAGADDSDRDLAAVGDQDLREHAAGTLPPCRGDCSTSRLARVDDHPGGDRVVGRLVDQDEAARRPVARVRVDHQRRAAAQTCTRPISFSASCWAGT